jgi:hypothetical protein
MNLKTAYCLAKVLTYSQLRATRSVRGRLDYLRRPFSILLIDTAAFLGAFVLVQKFISGFALSGSPLAVDMFLIDLPMFLMLLLMLSGLLWELSYSSNFTSSDMVNYLPISAGEYVLASSASVVFSYSAYLAAGLGGTLAIALQLDLLEAWIMSVVMSFVAVFIGAFGIEALRAFTNRASSLLYKRSGRWILILRMIVLIGIFVLVQLIFNPTIMLSILGGVAGGVKGAWFFPLAWPSLAIAALFEHNLLEGSLYAFLTFLLAGFLFSACVRLRRAYWTPMPVSVRLSATVYAPRTGFLSRFGLNPTEAALVRKDFRSLSRRREMAQILALPVVIVIVMVIPSLTSTGLSRPPLFSDIMFWAFPLLFGFMLFALMNSMMSVGQESYAVWNLYSSPITPKEFVRAKIAANTILSLPIALTFWFGIAMLGHPSLRSSTAFLVSITALVLVESHVGLMIGLAFPSFSETIRSRFVRLPGMLLGMLLGPACAGAVLAPYLLYLFFQLPWLDRNIYFAVVSFASLALMTLISAIAHHVCVSSTKKLLAELPM